MYGRPAPVYVQPAYPTYPVYPAYNSYPRPRHGGIYRQAQRWDRDGDGIPNRYDRGYNPARDRDGDGVPYRRDRHPNRPGHSWR